MKNVHTLDQIIYITSDEEIKEGDWCLSKLNEVVRFGKKFTVSLYKKIILTTDPDLIKDGVQPIDDEFLEWFVKNSTCENIPIIMTTVSKESTYKTNIGFESWRKEEPSQDNRMYSEEEVIDLLIEMNSWPTIFEGKEDITEWLNQSKNK